MITETNYNLAHLNQYFTTAEFNFINKISLGNQDINSNIDKQIKIRDVIVTFINRLDTSNSNLELVKNVQSIFEKVNENLKLMYLEKEDSENLSNKIVDLLIQIESSNTTPSSSYLNTIKNIKDQINDISQKNINYEKIIFENNNTIYSFIYSTNIAKYFTLFGITIPEDFHVNPETSQTNSVPTQNIETNRFANINENSSNSNDFSRNVSTISSVYEYSKEKYSNRNDSTNKSNNLLLVSEKKGKVYLPYTSSEINLYLDQYPDSYSSFEDVVKKEFVLPLDYYSKHPVVARFRESYSLIKDRESKTILDALKYAFDMMFRYELNPVIIAACKTQDQLEHYLDCIKKNKLDEFKDFEIKFEVSMRKK